MSNRYEAYEIDLIRPLLSWTLDRARGPVLAEGGGYSIAGLAGTALTLAGIYNITKEKWASDAAEELWSKVVAGANTHVKDCGLISGWAGVSWAAQRTYQYLYGSAAPNSLTEEFDQFIYRKLSTPWDGEYELVSGLVGIGNYALRHSDVTFGRKLYSQVETQLIALAVEDSRGLMWHTAVASPFRQIPGREPEINLGLAHGMPGIIALFAQAILRGYASRGGREVLTPACHAILAFELPDHSEARFPSTSNLSGSTQIAWCYGDPGVIVALAQAAIALADATLIRESERLVHQLAARCLQTNGNNLEAGLCHGTSGVMQVLRRLSQYTGVPEIAEAAQRWHRMTIDLVCTPPRYAGVRARSGRAGLVTENHSFLIGSAGVSLAIIANTQLLEWDDLLLLS